MTCATPTNAAESAQQTDAVVREEHGFIGLYHVEICYYQQTENKNSLAVKYYQF